MTVAPPNEWPIIPAMFKSRRPLNWPKSRSTSNKFPTGAPSLSSRNKSKALLASLDRFFTYRQNNYIRIARNHIYIHCSQTWSVVQGINYKSSQHGALQIKALKSVFYLLYPDAITCLFLNGYCSSPSFRVWCSNHSSVSPPPPDAGTRRWDTHAEQSLHGIQYYMHACERIIIPSAKCLRH